MRKVVLDTNVIVSALLSPGGPPARILDLVITGQLLLCFESRIIAEYSNVLRRPKFGFDPQAVDQLIGLLMQMGISVLAQPSTIDLIDESDRVFFDVAQTAGAYL
ncbi:putative toxin-antitoxin system toxin component, PIN family, partial [Eubacteriales bacterium OttesenSCG-928-A19]|nr:putative toxin-antitoxin system toxin component, PIN family [Eubacteriales bacterium OttesenSCG-928-A19]